MCVRFDQHKYDQIQEAYSILGKTQVCVQGFMQDFPLGEGGGLLVKCEIQGIPLPDLLGGESQFSMNPWCTYVGIHVCTCGSYI